jgi:hypothetical protein
MTTYILTPPTVKETPAGFGRLLINGTAVTRIRTPSLEECQAADYYYLGGSIYEIPANVATILINAGYSANIQTIP